MGSCVGAAVGHKPPSRARTGSSGEIADLGCCDMVAWKLTGIIGTGGYGVVQLATNANTGQCHAVKVLLSSHLSTSKVASAKLRFLEEIATMKRAGGHPNIVDYVRTVETADGIQLWMEYCPGGSLSSMLSSSGAASIPRIRAYVRDIINGLEFLHGMPIIHRDIKGANILLDKCGTAKLGDFGAVADLTDAISHRSRVGTPFWMAPEVMHRQRQDWRVDIWSLGCLVMELATATRPFSWNRRTRNLVFFRDWISNHTADELIDPLIDHPFVRDFIKLCLSPLESRPSTQDLKACALLCSAASGMPCSAPASASPESGSCYLDFSPRLISPEAIACVESESQRRQQLEIHENRSFQKLLDNHSASD
eukprot:NODE_1075_length_1722_cov_32.623431_g951_i0.p1 GENE.NODE_1075_length_1722_cov_32.623431_g951_i0~~NODE_1075_length_1722_cov_32.623431_g951_i0.p1  ORF type:complete len:366 (-),score=36.01 NODE_1075_length_1722_cov_32.623431_g951_i0:490-1587(-)